MPDLGLGRTFRAALDAAGLPAESDVERRVDPQELEPLPPVVQRYMAAMRVLDVPRVTSFSARFGGRFRRRPDERWMPASAMQYNRTDPVTRIFSMELRFANVLPMWGDDTYIRGTGRMQGRLLGLVTVADGDGEPFDIGELTTYLNDAILLAPSMLLTDAVTWEPVNGRSFDVTLRDESHSVRARVFLDDDDLPADFSSTDRFIDREGQQQRCEWRTPIQGWSRTGDRPMPGPAKATWHLPEGPLTYIEGRFEGVRYNEPVR